MIEIIIIIAVVKAFAGLAEEKNLNKTLWGFIGAASYYIPILLMSFVILPALVVNGIITVESETSITIMAVIANIIAGVLCCLIAYSILKNKTPYVDESMEDILDQEV